MKLVRVYHSVILHSVVLSSAAVVGSLAASPAFALDVDVNCAGTKVGTISVNSLGANNGISGSFTSVVGTPVSLAAAAATCKEDHFNWYQVVTADNGKAADASGNKLTAPYVDPPPGGYDYLWADNLPWYWNETAAPKGAKNVMPGYQLSDNTTKTALSFSDNPSSSGDISFSTWLVSVNADGSFQGFDGGFTWVYTSKTATVGNIQTLTGNPPDKYYKNIVTGFATSVPEPGMSALFLLGLFTMAWAVSTRSDRR